MNKVTVVPGDGIGPEVVGATCAIIKASGAKGVEFEEALVGLRAEKEFGTPLPVSVLESIERNKLARRPDADAVRRQLPHQHRAHGRQGRAPITRVLLSRCAKS